MRPRLKVRNVVGVSMCVPGARDYIGNFVVVVDFRTILRLRTRGGTCDGLVLDVKFVLGNYLVKLFVTQPHH